LSIDFFVFFTIIIYTAFFDQSSGRINFKQIKSPFRKGKGFVLSFKAIGKSGSKRIAALVVMVTVMSLDPNERHPVSLKKRD